VSLGSLEQSISSDSNSECDSSMPGSLVAAGVGNEGKVDAWSNGQCTRHTEGHAQPGASNLHQRVEEMHCTLADALRLQRRFTERFSGLIAQQNKRLDSVADSVQQITDLGRPSSRFCEALLPGFLARMDSMELFSQSMRDDISDLQQRLQRQQQRGSVPSEGAAMGKVCCDWIFAKEALEQRLGALENQPSTVELDAEVQDLRQIVDAVVEPLKVAGVEFMRTGLTGCLKEVAAQVQSVGRLREEVESKLAAKERDVCKSDEERRGCDHARSWSLQSQNNPSIHIASPTVRVLEIIPSKPKEVLTVDVETVIPTSTKQQQPQSVLFEHCLLTPRTSWAPPPLHTPRTPLSSQRNQHQPAQPAPPVPPTATMQVDSMKQQLQQQRQQQQQNHQRHPSAFRNTSRNRRGLCAAYSAAPHHCQYSWIPQDQCARSPSPANSAAVVPRLRLPPPLLMPQLHQFQNVPP